MISIYLHVKNCNKNLFIHHSGLIKLRATRNIPFQMTHTPLQWFFAIALIFRSGHRIENVLRQHLIQKVLLKHLNVLGWFQLEAFWLFHLCKTDGNRVRETYFLTFLPSITDIYQSSLIATDLSRLGYWLPKIGLDPSPWFALAHLSRIECSKSSDGITVLPGNAPGMLP